MTSPCETCGKGHRTEAAVERCAASAVRRASSARLKWKRAHDAVGDWCRRRENLEEAGGLRVVIREKRWQWGKRYYDFPPPRTFDQVATDLNRDYPLRPGGVKWEAIDVVEVSNRWLHWGGSVREDAPVAAR